MEQDRIAALEARVAALENQLAAIDAMLREHLIRCPEEKRHPQV